MNLLLPLIYLYAFLEEVGRVRAAAGFARAGNVEAACKLMMMK